MSAHAPATTGAGGRNSRVGLVAGLASYLIWGFFPLYFVLLAGVSPWEVLLQRIVWATAASLAVVLLLRQGRELVVALRTPRAAWWLGLAALFIGVVWLVYGWGALTQRSVEVALGYFICPLVTVLLAAFVQKERLSLTVWVSTALGAAAAVVMLVGQGEFPVISTVVAVAFALYSLAKSRAGRLVGAVPGMAAESVLLVPVGILVAVWLYGSGQARFGVEPWAGVDLWLVVSGPVTVLPLLLFAIAARNLSLSALGYLQYLNPVLQLATATLLLGEAMTPTRWWTFGLIWVALAVYLVGSWRERRASAALTSA